jgi:hypothetical protein
MSTSTVPTRDELLTWPATVPLWPDAARAIGAGRTAAYEMAQDGTWPTRLLRVGSRYRVPTAELLEILGITRGTDDAA